WFPSPRKSGIESPASRDVWLRQWSPPMDDPEVARWGPVFPPRCASEHILDSVDASEVFLASPAPFPSSLARGVAQRMKNPKETGASKPGARRARTGWPLHAPTAETCRQVALMAAFGNSEGEIARIVGVSEPTLKRHYRCELDDGHVRANNEVAGN